MDGGLQNGFGLPPPQFNLSSMPRLFASPVVESGRNEEGLGGPESFSSHDKEVMLNSSVAELRRKAQEHEAARLDSLKIPENGEEGMVKPERASTPNQ